MITISKEDYLKAISEAEAEGQPAIAATLAHWLSVTRPAVTFALKRLKKDGLVSVGRDGQIALTSEGRRIAEQTSFRHHLIERMLSEMFGMAWYEVHDEAERLEHAVSPAVEKKLVEKLGARDLCPHGNGLTLRGPADKRKKGLRLLPEAELGVRYTVASVYERDRKLLEFLDKEGIRPGVQLSVKEHNYDGTLSIEIDNPFGEKTKTPHNCQAFCLPTGRINAVSDDTEYRKPTSIEHPERGAAGCSGEDGGVSPSSTLLPHVLSQKLEKAYAAFR